jgi:hypothetical protein
MASRMEGKGVLMSRTAAEQVAAAIGRIEVERGTMSLVRVSRYDLPPFGAGEVRELLRVDDPAYAEAAELDDIPT